jgi:hypothetical protein
MLALTLLTAGAQAADEQVTFQFSNPANTFPLRSITAQMGSINPIQVSDGPVSGKCEFNKKYFDATVKSTIELSSAGSMALTIMPIMGDDQGVKALIVIRSEKILSNEWVDINDDCKLPLGKSVGAGYSLVKVMKWGEKYPIELPDASFVTIVAQKG